MARFSDMLGHMRAMSYHAPDAVLERALLDATQELCKYAQCWQLELGEDALIDGHGTYELMPPYDVNVDKILWVKIGGKRLRYRMRPQELLSMDESHGMPTRFAQDSTRQEIHFWPTPTDREENTEVRIYAAVSPTLRTKWLPDGLVDEYHQGIVAAAKANLLTNSHDMPWFNPQAGMQQRMLADEIFARAKRAQHSGHSGLLTVAPRPFI